MHLLERIDQWAVSTPNRLVHIHRDQQLTYAELKELSDALSVWIKENISSDDTPIIVYGHKQSDMLICFMACVKAGHAYIPVDISMPNERIKNIIESSRAKLFINVTPADFSYLLPDLKVLKSTEGTGSLRDIYSAYRGKSLASRYNLHLEDDFYIIYTSGSTGKPKGVRITLGCLISFINWAVEEFSPGPGRRILNQAPFSFDLSVMDLYLALATGGTLWCVDKEMVARPRELFAGLSGNPINIWVSTPSFAEYCLVDRSFSNQLLADLEAFVFCGEILTNECVRKLHDRFPKAKVFNSYGPTEATVAVTSILITKEVLNQYLPLPIGRPKRDTQIMILDEEENLSPDSSPGEIIIKGPSVSPGYLNDSEKTKKAFFEEDDVRCYRTGDEGFFKDNLLFYSGRKDNQIKLHGYRIELEDIENKIKSLPKVRQAAVLPRMKDGKCYALNAFVSLEENIEVENELIFIRQELAKLLPEYMIPQKFFNRDELPLTANGKVNRKQLAEVLK